MAMASIMFLAVLLFRTKITIQHYQLLPDATKENINVNSNSTTNNHLNINVNINCYSYSSNNKTKKTKTNGTQVCLHPKISIKNQEKNFEQSIVV